MQKITICGLRKGISKNKKPYFMVNWLVPMSGDDAIGMNCYTSFVSEAQFDTALKYIDKECDAITIHGGNYHSFEILEK